MQKLQNNPTQTANKHTLSVLVSYNLNALSRIIGIFSGKGFEIDSISFGSGKRSDLARITITTHGDEQVIEQITKQLHKIIIPIFFIFLNLFYI